MQYLFSASDCVSSQKNMLTPGPLEETYGAVINWTNLGHSLAAEGVGTTFHSTIDVRFGLEDKDPSTPLPPMFNNQGLMSRKEYTSLMSNSRAMLGIGDPEISPSPYLAL